MRWTVRRTMILYNTTSQVMAILTRFSRNIFSRFISSFDLIFISIFYVLNSFLKYLPLEYSLYLLYVDCFDTSNKICSHNKNKNKGNVSDIIYTLKTNLFISIKECFFRSLVKDYRLIFTD